MLFVTQGATWREGINSRFELLFFTVLAQSVAAIIAAVVGPTGRWRSTMAALAGVAGSFK